MTGKRLGLYALLLPFTLVLLLGGESSAWAGRQVVSGWLPDWTTATSVGSFTRNADLFTSVSPFWYEAVKDSGSPSGVSIHTKELSSGTTESNTILLKNKGAGVWPSITDGTGRGVLAGVLADGVKRTALVNQILSLVVSKGYDGVDLDFETFAFTDGSSTWPVTRVNWVAFIAQLGNTLHANGKQLSLAVPPIYNARQNSSSGYWVYDYAATGVYIDKLRIMAYDYSWDSPGSIGGPLSWNEQILIYATSVVSPSKIVLGTPTYGRDWVTSKTGVGCPSLSRLEYDSKNLATAISGVGASSWVRDTASKEMHVNYTKSYNGGLCTVTRSAWLPDTTTVMARLALADRYGIDGLALWTVGGEDASLWAALRSYTFATPVAKVSLTGKSKVRKGTKVTFSGKVLPKRKNILVQVQVFKNKSWVTIGKVKTKAGGVYKTQIKVSKTSQYRSKVMMPNLATGYSVVRRVKAV